MKKDKIETAIHWLRILEKEDDVYNLAFSGGKDSVVIYKLARMAGVKFIARHGMTTIDPPGTVQFIKRNYPDILIIRPKKTFLQLVEQKGLPTRTSRFCCEHLKERVGIGRRNITGVRAEESRKRASMLHEVERCDHRSFMKNAKHITPIFDWKEKDIWSFIKEYELPYMPWYDAPYHFKRFGCVGCPLISSKKQIKEFRIFPKYAMNIIRAIRRNMDNRPSGSLASNFHNNEYEAFYWWVRQKSIKSFHHLYENELFGTDFKTAILEMLQRKSNFQPKAPNLHNIK